MIAQYKLPRTIHHMNARLPHLIVTTLAVGIFSGCAQTNAPQTSQATPAETQHARALTEPTAKHTIVPASKPTSPPSPVTSGRGSKPLHAVTGVASGQTGYVHYFLLRMPDETLEVQVGIELADQRIAWSFPDLGVVISPFIDGEDLQAGEKNYTVWHLYGLRPFPDDATMTRLHKDLPGRIAPWVKAQTTYCLDDSPKSNCMSCLGFVLRALFPGRGTHYPGLPRDFWHTAVASRYTPNDLLLYLSGMLDQSTRNARLQRLAKLNLPADLRNDLEELIHAMGPGEARAAALARPLTSRQKKTSEASTRTSTPPAKRRPL